MSNKSPSSKEQVVIPAREVAVLARCSSRTVRRAILAGELRGAQDKAGTYYVPLAAAEAWASDRLTLVPVLGDIQP